MQQATFEI